MRQREKHTALEEKVQGKTYTDDGFRYPHFPLCIPDSGRGRHWHRNFVSIQTSPIFCWTYIGLIGVPIGGYSNLFSSSSAPLKYTKVVDILWGDGFIFTTTWRLFCTCQPYFKSIFGLCVWLDLLVLVTALL